MGEFSTNDFDNYDGGEWGGPVGSSYDADALSFFTAASITDATQKTATNQLVIDLKAASIWTKMQAIYPFVGGTAATHKWNLKDPRDLDAAFRLTFTGGWTHSSTGAKPNGTNGNADTFLVPSTVLAAFSRSLGYYSTENTVPPVGSSVDMGAYSTDAFYLGMRRSGIGVTEGDIGTNGSGAVVASSNSAGFTVASRISNADLRLYLGGSQIASQLATQTGSTVTSKVLIADLGGASGYYSDRNCALCFVGDGLTSGDVSALNTAVQAFQTTLSRNV